MRLWGGQQRRWEAPTTARLPMLPQPAAGPGPACSCAPSLAPSRRAAAAAIAGRAALLELDRRQALGLRLRSDDARTAKQASLARSGRTARAGLCDPSVAHSSLSCACCESARRGSAQPLPRGSLEATRPPASAALETPEAPEAQVFASDSTARRTPRCMDPLRRAAALAGVCMAAGSRAPQGCRPKSRTARSQSIEREPSLAALRFCGTRVA